MTATGCQALGYPLREHTLSQTLPAFGRGRQTPCCPGHARQLLHALRSYRALNQTLLTESPPLVHPTRPVPPESVRQEVPRLGHGYCATWRHCLNRAASLAAFRRFQGGDVHSPSLTHRLSHRRRTMASCLWLHVAPHSTLEGCRYRFELSTDPWFPKVPTRPGFPSASCTVTGTSKAILCGRRYALSTRPAGQSCTDFHH